jgi:hypothetical protein
MSNGSSQSKHPTTTYRTYTPRPPLTAFIDKFWLYEGYNSPHAKEHRLPDGSMELVINRREDVIRIYGRRNHDQFRSIRGCVISGTYIEVRFLQYTSLYFGYNHEQERIIVKRVL